MEDGGGSAQQERIKCQNFVDLRRYGRSSMAKSPVATSTKSESNLEVGLPRRVRQQPTFVFWRETFSSTFSSGAKMSRAFACADQRLMASPLRQTSHSAMHRGFLPPFFFCGCWCNFFFTAPFLSVARLHVGTTTLTPRIRVVLSTFPLTSPTSWSRFQFEHRKRTTVSSVTGTMKHVKSSVARSGGIVLRWSNGYCAGG